MDNRTTLKSGQSFLDLLMQLQNDNIKASMLLDCNGMIRAEGMISEIVMSDIAPYLKLQSGEKIDLSAIVAVNGIFSPDYSEC